MEFKDGIQFDGVDWRHTIEVDWRDVEKITVSALEDEEQLRDALIEAGAPDWVRTGLVDFGENWFIMGPDVTEANPVPVSPIDSWDLPWYEVICPDGGVQGYRIPWADVVFILGYPHSGENEEDDVLIEGLLAAGAPEWVIMGEVSYGEGGWYVERKEEGEEE